MKALACCVGGEGVVYGEVVLGTFLHWRRCVLGILPVVSPNTYGAMSCHGTCLWLGMPGVLPLRGFFSHPEFSHQLSTMALLT